MIYNSNAASKPTAAKKPAFYWKKQAQAPSLLPGGASMSGIKASPPQLAPTERSLIETQGLAVRQTGLDSGFQPVALKGAGAARP